ncbi:MAG: hypothetical protein AAF982_00135 [Pseudomonadota bacterium]
MSEMTLTKTRLQAGIWEGVLSLGKEASSVPEIEVTLSDQPIENVELHENGAADRWVVRVPIEAAKLTEGVQTYLISDKRTGARLNSFTVMTGDAIEDDLRAEVALLRAELDMLKRAFRRHCLVETH